MAEENGSKTEANGSSPDFDIPTITAATPQKKGKKGAGPVGLGGAGGSQAVQGAGLAARLGSGPFGMLFRNFGLILKFAPAMVTIVTGLLMPAYNNARNKAIYEDAIHRAQLLKSAKALPSDEAVAKMRGSTNLDNEALVRARNGGKGMKFGEDGEPQDPNKADDGKAKDANVDKNLNGATAADKGAADASKIGADAMKNSGFGKGEFGKGGFGGGGGGGGGSGFGQQITNYAPKSNFGSLKGKGGGMDQGKGTNTDHNSRTLALGKRGRGFGQLKAAALYSKKATTQKYGASAATAGKAFDSGTMSADNSVRGVGGEGLGTGGAGVGDGNADGAAADALAKSLNTTPKIPPQQVPKNDSCSSENKDSMDPSKGGPMTQDEYDKLKGKCDAQSRMNTAFLWLAAAALMTIPLAIMNQTAQSMLSNPFTAAGGAAWKIALIAISLATIVAANIIAFTAMADAMQYPSLKSQAVMLGAGAVLVDIAALAANAGEFAHHSIMATSTMVSQALGNATQGMQSGG